MPDRLWEIDCLRGIAIIMMIVFHAIFDMYYFGGYSLDIYSGFWLVFARVTASIFIFLVGISLTLSYSRAVKEKKGKGLFFKYAYRGLKIFSWGLIITLITWIFLKQGFIVFGVLHFIGIAIILAYFFLKLRFANLLLGIVFFALGIYLHGFVFEFPWLLWLGFTPSGFYTVDYFPLLPWLGLVLIGIFFGKTFYPDGKSRIRHVNNPVTNFFCMLGRRSLLIYLLHQPVLIAMLYVFVLEVV